MRTIRPWAFGPFELLVHGEEHLRKGDDFDQRMAFVCFDETVEVSITTYLALHPIHRGGREYQKAQVSKWLTSFESRIDFLVAEIEDRKKSLPVRQDEFIWYHKIRNDLYHEGRPVSPDSRSIQGVRLGALAVFAELFDVQHVERELEEALRELVLAVSPQPRDDEVDRLLDDTYGLVTIAGRRYYTSKALYAVDPVSYGLAVADAGLSAYEPEGEA